MRALALTTLLFVIAAFVTAPHVVAQKKYPDLYNLGPLGGKTQASKHGGKSALKVVEVFKVGPAQTAGLKVGDLIIGAGDKAFDKNAYLELGDAILVAEADAEAHSLTLSVMRGGEALALTVALKHYADHEARRKAIKAGTLKWLARQQDSKEGGFYSNMSPEVSQVVLTSLAGLCWLSDGADGDYQSNILKAADFVKDKIGQQKRYKKLGGKNNNQTNWGLGYGGIFLAQLVKDGKAAGLSKAKLSKWRKKLGWIRDRIFKQCEDNGGFAHGPGGANILDYIHFEAMSNFCLAALGAINAAGVEVDDEKLAPLIKYVDDCQMPDGGIGYAHDKKWFSEVGRTAGAMNAFGALGVTDRDSYTKMLAYMKKNIANAFNGHSTPTMHQLSVALACKRHGLMEEYWQHHRREFTMVRNPDFSFAYRPTAETARMGDNLDRNIGLVWTTTQWLLISEIESGAASLWVGTLESTD